MTTEQGQTCIRCGEHNKAHFRFCWKCGTSLAAPPQQTKVKSSARGIGGPQIILIMAIAIASAGYLVTIYVDSKSRTGALAGPQVSLPASPPKETVSTTKPTPAVKSLPSKPVPVVASSVYWPQERHWAVVDSWLVYETNGIGCFARKTFPGDLALIMGRMAGSNDFVLGLTGSVANLPSPTAAPIAVAFDGNAKKYPYFEGKKGIVAGRFPGGARLIEDLAASSALQVFGNADQVASFSLKGSRDALTAIVNCVRAMSTDAGRTRESALPKIRFCENRPGNGQFLSKRRGAKSPGHTVTIRNSSEGDAIVKMRDEATGKVAYSFFVHRGGEATVEGVADGGYKFQFAYGRALEENCKDYSEPRASQFDKIVRLATKVERAKTRGNRTTIMTTTQTYTATLYAVPDGNVTISMVDPQAFLSE